MCVFERDWKRNSFPKPTLRRFGGRKRVANVVVARHGPKVRRSLSLSLCVCVCVSLFFVCSRYLLVARGGRVILFLYIFEIGKKKSPTKTQKTRRLVGEKFAHAHCARSSRSFVLYHKHQTTDHLKRVLPVLFLFLPSRQTTTRARARESPGGRSRRGSRRRHEKTRRAELPETLERSLER